MNGIVAFYTNIMYGNEVVVRNFLSFWRDVLNIRWVRYRTDGNIRKERKTTVAFPSSGICAQAAVWRPIQYISTDQWPDFVDILRLFRIP